MSFFLMVLLACFGGLKVTLNPSDVTSCLTLEPEHKIEIYAVSLTFPLPSCSPSPQVSEGKAGIAL